MEPSMTFTATLRFTGENSGEYLTMGTHLFVVPTTEFTQGKLVKGDVLQLVDEQTGQRGAGRVIGYITGVTKDRFHKHSDILKLGPSHIRTPRKLESHLEDAYPSLATEYTFIGFQTYLVEVPNG